MIIRRLAAGLGVVLLSALAQGAESGAPLESTRAQLRKLESDQKTTTGPSPTEGLRETLPAIQAPNQAGLPALTISPLERSEKERQQQKQARKNWLVDGVESLERKDRDDKLPAWTESETGSEGEAPGTLDRNDPQYLLRLYDDQKKTEPVRQSDAKLQRAAPADPLAPFLQNWLGNSPVRGQFFDEFVRKPDGGAAAGTVASAPPPSNSLREVEQGVAFEAPVLDRGLKPNPYLADLNPAGLPLPAGLVPVATNLVPSGPVDPTPGQAFLPGPGPSSHVLLPEKKPLLAPLADDKKYFPQLKKF
jgi:hypothetical protein